jgi:hypothetical protein
MQHVLRSEASALSHRPSDAKAAQALSLILPEPIPTWMILAGDVTTTMTNHVERRILLER